ncbi:hypothetical protein D3C81_2267290 [compost metagenome]
MGYSEATSSNAMPQLNRRSQRRSRRTLRNSEPQTTQTPTLGRLIRANTAAITITLVK